MEPNSNARQTTQSLPGWDGDPLAPWRGVRSYFATKACELCGKEIRPLLINSKREGLIPEAETLFNKRRFCGNSCAKKSSNPMHSAEIRKKVSDTIKRIGHKPKVRGGNGMGITPTEQMLLAKLSKDWVSGYVVKTLKRPSQGYPHHYKLDLALPSLQLCVELDGGSHGPLKRQMQDQKKDALLRALGWKVCRLSNTKAVEMFSTCESVDTHLILQMAS